MIMNVIDYAICRRMLGVFAINSLGGKQMENSITSLMLPLFICYCYITSSGLSRAARPDMFLIYRIYTFHYFTYARKYLHLHHSLYLYS